MIWRFSPRKVCLPALWRCQTTAPVTFVSCGLERGESSELGQQQQLSSPKRGVWTGMMLDETPSLILADSTAPRLMVWSLSEDGFSYRDVWPGVSKVRGMVAAQDRLILLAR